jgi:hypothetical protein
MHPIAQHHIQKTWTFNDHLHKNILPVYNSLIIYYCILSVTPCKQNVMPGAYRGIVLLILSLSTSWMAMISCTPQPLNARETYHSAHWTICRVDPRDSLDVLEKTKILSLSGMEPWFLHHSACSLATTMTWLTQFQVCIKRLVHRPGCPAAENSSFC